MNDVPNDHAGRVALVAHSTLFADAVSQSLESAKITIVAAVTPKPASLEALHVVEANVVLVEAGGTLAETASLLRRIQQITSLPTVVIGADADDAELVELIEAGCCGCVPRDASLLELVDAVRNVCCGRAECSPYLAALVSARIRALSRELTGDVDMPALTRRELEVLQLAALSLSNKEIAHQLDIWVQTVKSHLHNIHEKLGARTRRDAVTRALRLGLIREP